MLIKLPCLCPQTYIRSMDKDFVAATIQAIGRCATNIGKVRDTCLNGLVQLLSNRDGEGLRHGHRGTVRGREDRHFHGAPEGHGA